MPRSFLVVLNDGPSGNERSYNALRLAMNLAKRPDASVRDFLIGNGVQGALAGQETPQGYYNLERRVASLAKNGEVTM